MARATVKWLDGKRFVGVDSTEHGVVISGTGEDGRIGAKPSDLLLLALGSCTAYDVVNILEKKRQKLTGLEVQVTAEQEPEAPWTFTSFHVHYVVRGRGLSMRAVEDAIRLSDEKYCSVSATLRKGATVTHDFEVIEEG
ncbi:MAG: OsmC family protein [Anaerolineae bacterium]